MADQIQRPVVQRLLRLMEFRNDYGAFGGDFSIEEAPDDQIVLSWRHDALHATARIDLNTYRTVVDYFDPKEGRYQAFDV